MTLALPHQATRKPSLALFTPAIRFGAALALGTLRLLALVPLAIGNAYSMAVLAPFEVRGQTDSARRDRW